MTLTFSNDSYDFYTGLDGGGSFYNIVPKGSPAPSGGYRAPGYIMYVKGCTHLGFAECFSTQGLKPEPVPKP